MARSIDLDPSRLRKGEWIVGASSLLLLASLLLLKWYSLGDVLARTAATLGFSRSVTGWHELAHIRWLVVVTIVCGLALVYFQASRKAPAIPASLSVIVTVLALLTLLALLFRVVIDVPGEQTREVGAWLGLASAAALLVGAFLSLRTEGIAKRDEPHRIETVGLDGDGGPTRRDTRISTDA